MGLITTLGSGQGYLKAGLLGFAGSGKTVTAAILAAYVRKELELPGPIAMFDTEGGSEYVAARVKGWTGLELVGVRSRAFSQLLAVGREAVAGNVSVLIVDSITHVWQELQGSYLKQINERLQRERKQRRYRLEFQDMAQLKALWEEWTTFYLNSPLHIIVCGRAGFMWDFKENEDTGKNELIKTGVKMKVESEFGFEPSLLVEMERVQTSDGRGGFVLSRSATVLKDRFGVIDGKSIELDADEPPAHYVQTTAFFAPHVRLLTPGAHAPVDTATQTDTGADEEGDTAWARERKLRTILAEEIQGELVAAYPGQDAQSKQIKAGLIHEAFATRSWTAVESMDSERLRRGLALIRVRIHGEPPAEPEVGDPVPPVRATGEPVEPEQGDLVPALAASVEQAKAKKRTNGGQ